MPENSQYSLTQVTFSEIPKQVYRHDGVSIWQGSMKCNDMSRLAGEMQILYYIILKTYTHTWFQNVVSSVSISLSFSIPVDIISLIRSIRMYLYIHHTHSHPHIHTHKQKRISRDFKLYLHKYSCWHIQEQSIHNSHFSEIVQKGTRTHRDTTHWYQDLPCTCMHAFCFSHYQRHSRNTQTPKENVCVCVCVCVCLVCVIA